MRGAMSERREAARAADAEAVESAAPSFEQALTRLEGIVDRLERGDLELEDALFAFEEGVALTRQCAERLAAAERRIEVLVQEGERWFTRPLNESEGAE